MTALRGGSVLVTGASGGLGSALAVELARRGAVLTLVARDPGRLAAVEAPGHRLSLDLRDPDACRAAVAAAVIHGGSRLDAVFNAVGVVAFGPVAELTADTMEELFMANTFVPLMLTRAALAVMGPGAAVVNISGVIAEQNLPGLAAYGASKAAVASFDQAAAREARRHRIRVIDARPPHTETGLARHPVAGVSPPMPVGLSPAHVAAVIVEAVAGDVTDLPSTAFADPAGTPR